MRRFMYEEYIGKQLNEFTVNSIDISMSHEHNDFYELAIQIYNSKTNKLIYDSKKLRYGKIFLAADAKLKLAV